MSNSNKRIVPVKNIGLLSAWLLAVAGTGVLAMTMDSKSSQFFGTTGSQEQLISFQYPVEVVRVPVVEGQSVVQGAHLLEVRRSDLASKQAIIEDQIMEIQIAEREALADTLANLESLRAQQQTRLVEIDMEIQSLESRRSLNRRLMQDVSGVNVSEAISATGDKTDYIQVEITGLREARHHTRNSFQIQIDNLTSQLDEEKRPAKARIAELEERRAELNRQQADLNVVAQFNGSIGSVMQKPGEHVAPFTPVMTLYGARPSFIKGYIHEAIINEVATGSKVWIKSQSKNEGGRAYEGVVESIGSRIVEFPERLRSNPMVTSWGREVIVFIDQDTPLLLGEKVLVLMEEPESVTQFIQSAMSNLLPRTFDFSLFQSKVSNQQALSECNDVCQ